MQNNPYKANKIESNDHFPPGRIFHSATQVENGDVILIGGKFGQLSNLKLLSLVSVYNLYTQQWTIVNPKDQESSKIVERYLHAVGHINENQLMIFGGIEIFENQERFCGNELFEISYDSSMQDYCCQKIDIQGESPESRAEFDLKVVNKHLMLAGGYNQQQIFDDCWTIKLGIKSELLSWVKVDFNSRIMNPRYGHSIIQIQPTFLSPISQVLVFGGFSSDILNDYYLLELENDKWNFQQHIVKSPLEPRHLHSSIQYKDGFVNFGGLDQNNTFCRTIEFFQHEKKFHQIFKMPIGVLLNQSVVFKNSIIIFGGLSSEQPGKVNDDIIYIEIPNFNQQTEKINDDQELMEFDFLKQFLNFQSDINIGPGDQNQQEELQMEEEKNQQSQEEILVKPQRFPPQNYVKRVPYYENYPYDDNEYDLEQIHSHEKKDGVKIIVKVSVSSPISIPSQPLLIVVESGDHNQILKDMLKPKYYRNRNLEFSIEPKTLLNIIDQCTNLVQNEPISLELNGNFKIFGDIHGQYNDLMRLFYYHGSPYFNGVDGDIHKYSYLFLGDYVDRGNFSVEVLTVLMTLKLRYPKNVYLLRGNHEEKSINNFMGFLDECQQKYQKEQAIAIYDQFNLFFDYLPLAAVLENQIFCCHGGLGPTLFSNFQLLKTIQRPYNLTDPNPENSQLQLEILEDILWSDPSQDPGFNGNERGEGTFTFGPDQLDIFLSQNKFKMIFRAHELMDDGYQYFHQQQGITIFSATNYCGDQNNSGALVIVEIQGDEFQITPKIITPKPQKDINYWNVELYQQFPNTPYIKKKK